MSIYIKNQDMPKLGECYFLQIFHDGTVYDSVGRRTVATAIEIPPHGSLKDADKLIQFAKDKARQIADEEANPPRSIAVLGLSIEDVMNAPTIIEAEAEK